MSKFLSTQFSSLNAYTPGEQLSDKKYIKLNTNESPYSPPDAVIKAITDEAKKLNLYPNPDGTQLIEKLAQNYNVNPENIIIGNGSDELLAFSFLAFFQQGVLFPDITYGFYPVYAELYNITYNKIPLQSDFTINIQEYLNKNQNIVLANPNAPTGIALKLSQIEEITKSNPNHIILIDEAYVDFGAKSAVNLTKQYENLLVIHTYSKSRSLAGARLGYAIASPPIIEDLNKMKYSFNPYNVNTLTQTMGAIAIDEESYYTEKRNEIISTREYTKNKLQEQGFIHTDSKANFLFAKHPSISGFDLYSKLKENGILIRHWNTPRISDHIRITIGTPEQMDKFIKVIQNILHQ